MAYTTYGFYTSTYYGDSVDESSFSKWNDRASEKLNHLCQGRITDEVLTEYSNAIQKSTCALVDLLYSFDFATKNATDSVNGNIKSMSSGGQSISFGKNDTVITNALSDKVAQQRLMLDAVAEYLGDTGLLYMGV